MKRSYGAITVFIALLTVAALATPAEAASRTIRSQYNGKCLDADLNTINHNGTKVQLWDCNGQPQQQWENVGSTVRNVRNGKCLDADVWNISNNGTKVQLWDCNGSNQQKRAFFTGGTIKSAYSGIDNGAYSGRCLDADLNTINSNCTKIQLWKCNLQTQQKWSW